MKLLLVLFSVIGFSATAQTYPPVDKTQAALIAQEQLRHSRLYGGSPNGVQGLSGASTNFNVHYYRCEWEVDPAIRYISGKVTVYFTMVAAGTSVIMDLMSSLTVDSVKQRTSVLSKQQQNNLLTINFSATINVGTVDSFSVYYKGIPANTGFGSFIQDQHNGIPVIWSLSEPYGARDWWPCKNGLDDKSDSIDVLITHPSAYKAASNGLFQSETLIAGGTKKITSWKHRYPIAAYLICFAVTNYSVFNNSVQLGSINLPMQTYCYPENLSSFQAGTQNVLDALQLYHQYFGDYPFIKEKYGHVQFGWGGGMEHQTATFVISIEEGLIAHELAHQWFGDKITCGSWEDIWLNEGFASYLASFYIEHKYPATAISNRRNEINYITSQPGGSVKVDDTTNVGRIFDGRLSYNKGSHLIYMLRFKLGDTAFFKGIRNYMKDPALAYGYARTNNLKQHLEQASGQDLTAFFKQWYEGQGYPSYQVQWTPLGSGYVRIKMNQTTSHASVPFFEMPVALQFKNATQSKTVVVNNTSSGELFIEPIGFVADTVVIDPEYWLISKNNSSVRISDSGPSSVQLYPNPIGNQFTVYIRGLNASKASIAVWNAKGQRLYTKQSTLLNGGDYISIPSGTWAAGVYTIRIEAPNGFTWVRKLQK